MARKELTAVRQLVSDIIDAFTKAEIEPTMVTTMETRAAPAFDSMKGEDPMAILAKKFLDTGKVPTATWHQHAESAKGALGPTAMSVDINSTAVLKAQATIKTAVDNDISLSSRAKHNLDTFLQEQRKVRPLLEAAKQRLHRCKLDVAKDVGRKLVSQVSEYSASLQTILDTEPDQFAQLTELASKIGNFSELQVGDIVAVPHSGQLQKARVEDVSGAPDRILVSIWTEVFYQESPYEAGYDTSQKNVLAFPRENIYGGGSKVSQMLAPITIATASKACPENQALLTDPLRPEFMLGSFLRC